MELLLDTHVFLWALEASQKLSATASMAIQDGANTKLVSYASLWEITIKVALGKLELREPWPETLRNIERLAPDTILACTTTHLETLFGLHLHHRDPFDRVIVAQA